MTITIRKWKMEDLYNGLLETLKSLTEVGDISDTNLFLSTFAIMDANPDYHIFVADFDGEIIGTATLFVEQKLIHSCSKVGHIEDVVVKKDYQGMGVGKALMGALINQASVLSCACIRRLCRAILDCSDENMAFYEGMGFEKHENMMRLDF